jgi:hypothetical protein
VQSYIKIKTAKELTPFHKNGFVTVSIVDFAEGLFLGNNSMKI